MQANGQRFGGIRGQGRFPRQWATKPLWERACKRMGNGPGAFAAKAASHGNGLRSRCGSALASEWATVRGYSRPRPLPTAMGDEAAVGACLQANGQRSGGIRGQDRFPRQQATKPLWERACKRMGNGPGVFAAKAASHGNGLRSRCGSVLASEWATVQGYSRPRPLPTATGYEASVGACLQANGQRSGGIRGQGRFPRQWATKPLWERACKRVSNGPGVFAAKAASHGNGLRSRCGSVLASEWATVRGHSRPRPLPTAMGDEAAVGARLQANGQRFGGIRGQGRFPRQWATKPLWERACKRMGNGSGAFAAKAASHGNGRRSRCGSALASEWATVRGHSRPRPLPTAMGDEAAVGARLQANGQRFGGIRGQGRFPRQWATKPLWERACKRMGNGSGAFAAKAASHGNGLRSRCGSVLASEWATVRGHSRPRPLPTAMGYEAAVGARLQANGQRSGGIRGQGRFPRQWATKPLWERACKRMGNGPGAFAAKTASHGNRLRSRCGSVLASEWATVRGYSRPRPLPTAMGYEAAVGACLQANGQRSRGIRGQGRFPRQQATKLLWERACKRMGNGPGAFAAKAASHGNGRRSRCGSVLASE